MFLLINFYLLSRNGGEWVDGVKDMVHNTQRTNIHKITTLIESNLSKVDRRRHYGNVIIIIYARLGSVNGSGGAKVCS